MKFTIIVSVDENWLIGKDGVIPWRLPEDMKWFKQVTMGHPIICGRKTWESLPKKPLPGRYSVIVTHQRDDRIDETCNYCLAGSIAEAVYICSNRTLEAFIIGGAEIYGQFLSENLVSRMLISRVKGNYEGNVYFPAFDESRWKKTIIKQFTEFDIIEYGLNQ